MTLTSEYKGGVQTETLKSVAPGSVKSQWILAYDDASTLVTAGTQIIPNTIANSVFHWVRVPENATSMLIRARTPLASTVTTSPVVKVLGMNLPNAGPLSSVGAPSNTVTDASYGVFLRLDADTQAAAGITITIVNTASAYSDATYNWCDPYSRTPMDLLGSEYVGLVVTTAASISAGAAALFVKFLN